jgi:hypothetical protein
VRAAIDLAHLRAGAGRGLEGRGMLRAALAAMPSGTDAPELEEARALLAEF